MAAIASQGASRNLDVHQRYASEPFRANRINGKLIRGHRIAC
jgi:hypothetical protein